MPSSNGFLRLRCGERGHVLLAAQPERVTPVLQVVQRVVTRHLLDAAGLKADEGHGGAVTLIQRFGSAANLNITCTASPLRPRAFSVRFSMGAVSGCESPADS